MAGKVGIQKRGKHSYRVTVWDDGKRHRRTVRGTYAKAEREGRSLQAQLEAGETPPPPASRSLRFAEVVTLYQSDLAEHEGRRPLSVERENQALRIHLVPHFQDSRIARIRADMAREYVNARLATGANAKTVNREIAALRRVVTWAEANRKKTGAGPAQLLGLKMLRETRYRFWILQPAQFTEMVRRARGPAYPVELAPWIVLLLWTNPRRGTLENVRGRDVDLAGGVIDFQETKGDEAQRNPLFRAAKAAILELGPRRADERLFRTPRRKMYYAWRRLVAQMGLERVDEKTGKVRRFRYHDLRHTGATWLLESGTDLRIVGDLLGHKSLASTRVYTHPGTLVKQRAVERMARKIARETGAEWGRNPGRRALTGVTYVIESAGRKTVADKDLRIIPIGGKGLRKPPG